MGRVASVLLLVLACSGAETEPAAPTQVESQDDPELTPVKTVPDRREARSGPSEFVDERGIRWRLRAEPSEVTMAERASVRLTIEATNEGDTQIDPERHNGRWLFQGESHMGMSMWFGNGLRVTEWNALPPGMTVTDARIVGEHLFDAPGEYELAYSHGPGRSAVVRVIVTD